MLNNHLHMNHRLFFGLLLLQTSLSILACQQTQSVSPDALVGRWELTQGYINDAPNDRLKGTFFVFHPDGTMENNLPLGFDAPVPYEVDGKNLLQKGAQTFRYTIESATDSVLILKTELRGTHFRFEMKQAAPLIPEDTLPNTPEGALPADTLES